MNKFYLKGIWLYGDDVSDLHRFARITLSLSKTWYSSQPFPHYEIISPRMLDYLEKRKDVEIIN